MTEPIADAPVAAEGSRPSRRFAVLTFAIAAISTATLGLVLIVVTPSSVFGAELQKIILRTMQPSSVSLWLRGSRA